MRTALAASVAAVAKWTFVAVLVLVVVLERQSVWSRAAGTRFARPVPQPESRYIDLPERGQVYVESLLIMRTALAASIAAAAKWTFVAAPLGLQAVPERQSVWSIAAGTRFARPVPQPESRHIDLPERGQKPLDYENRTCSQRCSRCQMDFCGCSSWVAGCSGTAVCVVKGSWNKICPSRSATRKPPY